MQLPSKDYIKSKITIENTLILFSTLCALIILEELLGAFLAQINDRVALSNFLNFFVKVFQNVIFGTLFLNLFLKFRLYYIGFILPFASREQENGFFANNVHNFLQNINFYSIFSQNPGNISPEYPRVIFFLSILTFSFILIFFRKWRSMPRIFISFGAAGVFITSILFHTVIITEIEEFKRQDSQLMESLVDNSNSVQEMTKACQLTRYACLVYPPEMANTIFSDNQIPEAIQKILPYLKPYFDKEKELFWYGISHDQKAMNRLLGQVPFALAKTENFSVIIKNNNTYTNFFIVNQNVFAWLALASHTVWFFGSLFLIYFHKRRIMKRQKT